MEWWVIKWIERGEKNPPTTSEGVPLGLLTPHFLTLPIRLISVAPPSVDAASRVVVEPKYVVMGAEAPRVEWVMAVSAQVYGGGNAHSPKTYPI